MVRKKKEGSGNGARVHIGVLHPVIAESPIHLSHARRTKDVKKEVDRVKNHKFSSCPGMPDQEKFQVYRTIVGSINTSASDRFLDNS